MAARMASTPSSSARPPATSRSGSRLPCSATGSGTRSRAIAIGTSSRLRRHRRRSPPHKRRAAPRRPCGNAMIRASGHRGAHPLDDRLDRPRRPARRSPPSSSTPAQLSKIFTTSAPAWSCATRYLDEASTRISISSGSAPAPPAPAVAPAAVPASPARRPCRSPPSRAPRRSRSAPCRGSSLARTCRTVSSTGSRRSSTLSGRELAPDAGSGSRTRPLPFDEAHLLAERIRHHQDVGEEDRSIEAEAADRLQRHFAPQAPANSKDRGTNPPSPAFRDIPEGSGRPGA